MPEPKKSKEPMPAMYPDREDEQEARQRADAERPESIPHDGVMGLYHVHNLNRWRALLNGS